MQHLPSRVHPLLEERELFRVRAPGRARTRLRLCKIVEVRPTLDVAPLDETSMVNDALKWDHPQYSISHGMFQRVLHWMEMMYGHCMSVEQWSKERVFHELWKNKDKACGAPWCYVYGPTKGDVLISLLLTHGTQEAVVDYLIECALNHDHIINFVQKDELRPIGKDSRGLSPSPIDVVALGLWLCGAQNESIMSWHMELPIRIGLEVPGSEAYYFWLSFMKHPGESHQADGKSWDKRFMKFLAMLCREFRKKHVSAELWHSFDLYYDSCYDFLINYGGSVLNVIGQQSGQVNTHMDNSLGHLFVLMIHALREGLSFDEFEKLWVAIVGDDLLLKDPIGCFVPSRMANTYNYYGMYNEAPSEYEDPLDATFCGMKPMKRNVLGMEKILYAFDSDKMKERMNWVKKGMTPSQMLAKYCAIASLVFADKEVFEQLREVCRRFAIEERHSLDRASVQLVTYLDDLHQLNHYCGYEPARI